MKKVIIWILLLSFCRVSAQPDSAQYRMNSISTSPDPVYKFNYKKLIIPSVLISYGALSLVSDDLKRLNQSTRYEINEHQPDHIKLDNYAQYFPAVLVYGLNALNVKGKHNFKDRSIILGTSLLVSSIVVLPTKHLVKEERPDGSSYLSFPSGHTATAFATAQFMFREYQDKNLWISLSGYPFAVFTGVYRTLNNKHWVGDVVAGAGIGILSTEVAYWLFPIEKKIFNGPRLKSRAVIYPFYQNKSVGLTLTSHF